MSRKKPKKTLRLQFRHCRGLEGGKRVPGVRLDFFHHRSSVSGDVDPLGVQIPPLGTNKING
jgi:hypothetical protein